MSKKIALVALLVACVMLLSACSLEMKDATVDSKQTIIEVNGEHISKSDFSYSYNYNLYMAQYYAQLMAYFGGDSDVDEDEVLQETVDSIIQSTVLSQKATELGFDTFTDEQLAEIQATADENYQEQLEYIKTNNFASSELTGEELDAAVAAYAEESGYTAEYFLSYAKSSKTSELLKKSVTDLVTITDDDIQAVLDEKIASEKETYAETPATYGTSVASGTTTYYTPAGYRVISVIKVEKPAASETSTEAAADTTEAAADTTEAAAEAVADTSEIDALVARLNAGEAFESLSENVTSYTVCAESVTPDAAVVAAAMALETEGTCTDIIETDSAYYLAKYVSAVAEHAATLDEVRDSLQATVLSDAQTAAYNAAVAEWVAAADVKTYTDRLN